jgi:hypothetical protein
MKIKIDNRGGDALGYDFIITKSGEKLDTEYDINTGNAEPVSPEITKAYIGKNVTLETLYTGADAFAVQSSITQQKSSLEASQKVSESAKDAVEAKDDAPFLGMCGLPGPCACHE